MIDLTNGRVYSQEGTGSSLDNLVRTVLADYKAQDPGQVISVVPASSESSAGAATTQELSDSPTYSVAVADIKISGNTGANEPVIKDAIYDALKSCVSIHPDVTLGYSYRQSKDEHRFDQIWSSSITNPRPKIGATQKGANGLRVKGALAVRFKGSTWATYSSYTHGLIAVFVVDLQSGEIHERGGSGSKLGSLCRDALTEFVSASR